MATKEREKRERNALTDPKECSVDREQLGRSKVQQDERGTSDVGRKDRLIEGAGTDGTGETKAGGRQRV